MALTPAEKQRRYRQRHLGVDGTKDRIQLFISVQTKAQLRRLARHHGYTVTKAIERLAVDAERELLDRLPRAHHRAYFDGEADATFVRPKRQVVRKQQKSTAASRRRVTR